MKKIVIFGASGDIGKYLVNYFIENDTVKSYEIIAVGTRRTDYFKDKGVCYFQVDITKKEEFKSLPDDVYAVIDLAGIMPARMKGYDPQKYIDVNITGTLNILEYCRFIGADRILFAQSFGDIKEHAEEHIVLTPYMTKKFSYTNDHTVYVLSKNFAVDLIEHYHSVYGIKNFIFRLPTIYLWSQNDTYFVGGVKRIIGYRSFISKALNGEPIEMWGDKTRKKDMVYVKDFCQMLYKAVSAELNHGYYNVGTGIGTTLEDQIKGIIKVFGTNGVKSSIIERPDLPNAPQYIMDITAAVNELNYTPQYDYISMLKDMKAEMIKGRF